MSSRSGLSTSDYCYLKCWVALVRVGKQLLLQVLNWGYPNPDQLTFREALRQLQGYSNTKYKNDFNKDERNKIESGDVKDFDITLLNTLVHRLCQLVSPTAQIYSSDNKLSELILKVKDTRNSFAHPLLGLNDIEMSNHLNEMKFLFEQVIDEAQNQFHVDVDEIHNVKNEIGYQLMQIIQSPLPAASIVEQLAQVAAEKSRIVVQEGVKELHDTYRHFTEISVTPWPFVPIRRNVNEIFITNGLKFRSSYCLQNRLTDEESKVNINNLLNEYHLDGSIPGVVLLEGQSGIGKTTLLKYLTWSWLYSSSSFTNSEQIDLLFYIDCRSTCLTNLNNFFTQVIPNTSNLFAIEELKNIIMNLDCVFLLDNLDEVCNKSMFIIDEIISGSSANTRIVATITQDPGNHIQQKSLNKRPMNLIIGGIDPDENRFYLKMLHDSLPEEYRKGGIEIFLSEMLVHGYQMYDWLKNPEILSHLFFHWNFSSTQTPGCSTLTHILLQSFNLILKKIKDRVASKSFSGVVEQHLLHSKLQCFLLELGRIALSSSKDETSGLGFKSTSQLLLKCQELGLPANILLSEFLCFRESFDEKNMQTSVKVNFPSVSFQEFCSAYHIYTIVNQSEITINLKDEFCLDEFPATPTNKSRIANILKFTVGLLATNKMELLSKYSPNIMEIFQNYCEITKPIKWFQVLEEAQGNIEITNLILGVLQQQWQVEDRGISNLVLELLKSSPPDVLSLVAVNDPSTLPHFTSALQQCSSSRHPIKLSLYIYSHFWKSCNDNCDQYLNIVTRKDSSCQLKNFAGKLSSAAYFLLPKSLTRLALQLHFTDLKQLNIVLPRLENLQLLSLNLNFEIDMNINADDTNLLQLQDNVMLSLDLWNASPQTTTDYVRLVAGLSVKFTRLALRRTTLNYKAISKFIVELGRSGAVVTSMVVGSTSKILQHEMVNLTSDARNHLGTSNFKWIEL